MRTKLKPKLNYTIRNQAKFNKHKEAYLKEETKVENHNLVLVWQRYYKGFDLISIGVKLLELLKTKRPTLNDDFLFIPGDLESIKGYGEYKIRYEQRGLFNHLLISGTINLIITEGHLL